MDLRLNCYKKNLYKADIYEADSHKTDTFFLHRMELLKITVCKADIGFKKQLS